METVDIIDNVGTHGVFRFMTPEEIDGRIKAIIRSNHRVKREGARCSNRKSTWTEVDIMIRNQVIFDYVGQGLSRRRILEQLMARWECARTTADRYYVEAMDSLKKDSKEAIDTFKAKQLSRLEDIMSYAFENNDLGSYLKACDQYNKITGIYREDEIASMDTVIRFKFGDEK